MNTEEDASVPPPAWGSPMQHSVSSGIHVVSAKAPGLFRSPPALRLLLLGSALIVLGVFVIVGAAIGSFREFKFASIFAFLIGGGVGALIAWLGILGLRWAGAAAWGVTEITLGSDVLRIRRAGWQAEITRADFRSTSVTDQFQLAHELLVMADGHRIVRILSGRGVAELAWLAHLIESQLTDEPESDVA